MRMVSPWIQLAVLDEVKTISRTVYNRDLVEIPWIRRMRVSDWPTVDV
jgi:hypothetical protein